MDIQLFKAELKDAQTIWEMQVKSFQKLLDKYQDFETSPASETVDNVRRRLEQENTYYYFICMADEKVGAVRVIDYHKENENKRISPIFVLPEFQGQGIAQKAIRLCEAVHGSKGWELDTILQEKGNCHLYEKMGYHATDRTEKINDKLTLIFYHK